MLFTCGGFINIMNSSEIERVRASDMASEYSVLVLTEGSGAVL
jgi:hypothetical protein